MKEIKFDRQTERVIPYIKSDCYRYSGKCDVRTLLKVYLRNSTFRWQVAFRLCKGKKFVEKLGRLLWVINRNKSRIQISRTTQIGYGLYIGHGGPVVINPTVLIGDNCNLSPFVTIGSNHGHSAVIGDNVYIGPNVCVVEDVKLGDNVTIGAGSVVTKDIPTNATAAGNYAKVLNYNNPGRYIGNRWCHASRPAKNKN